MRTRTMRTTQGTTLAESDFFCLFLFCGCVICVLFTVIAIGAGVSVRPFGA